jgi:hypothetical protein
MFCALIELVRLKFSSRFESENGIQVFSMHMYNHAGKSTLKLTEVFSPEKVRLCNCWRMSRPRTLQTNCSNHFWKSLGGIRLR